METFSALLAICAGNSPVPGEFLAKRPVTRSFDVFFDLRVINGWVNNGEAGDLRRYRAHYDVTVMLVLEKVPVVLSWAPLKISWDYLIQQPIWLNILSRNAICNSTGYQRKLINIRIQCHSSRYHISTCTLRVRANCAPLWTPTKQHFLDI